MKKLSLLLLILLNLTFLGAQITLSPEKPGFSELVTLTYDATQGNGALENYKGDIYAHTGLITLVGDSRPTPSSNPRISASTIDIAAAVRVPTMPGRT